MRLTHRPIRGATIAVLGLAMTAMTGAFATSALASGTPGPRMVALSGNPAATGAARTGSFSEAQMTVEVALAPRNLTGLQALLQSLYTPGNKKYQHWLLKGQFNRRFGPSAATTAAVDKYLTQSGLTITDSGSPFLVTATGSSQKIAAAFDTSFSTYRNAHGTRYFANSSAARMPASLASSVLGVVGLNDAVREHDMVQRATSTVRPSGRTASAPSSTAAVAASKKCEDGYPTDAHLFNFFNKGTAFASGYGDGPSCSGLTPAQTNSIYDAPHVGPKGKGKGETLAVFELSAYQASDIDHWAHFVYGSHFNPSLENVNVDGGPLHPKCPKGDTCQPAAEGYSGDIEVDADIEMQLTIAPDLAHIIVYNAPNDETGQTELAEYTRIANDDSAATISSSWGGCESSVGAAMAKAEDVVFEQMATQGQSMFAAAGDNGAFTCGTTPQTVSVDDPAAQPWVTGVGGTSLQTDNPGTNTHPAYPAGVESVWNVNDLCNEDANEGGTTADPDSGLFWCTTTGAGGGGSSSFWGRPWYQRGPGVNNPDSTVGNGTTQCAFAAKGTHCREVPDISANADEYTGYAEYCTGSNKTPGSVCATFSGSQPSPGWFEIGGTSLSSPLWSGIAADRDSFQGHRVGNFNPMLYELLQTDPSLYFHDITGVGQTTLNNGFFPTTPGYDEATGIGTPRMSPLIIRSA
jgi:subtilase family serine protease